MSRKRRLEREKARQGQAPVLEKLASLNLPKNAKLIREPVGVKKMSEVLLEFADPYIEYWDDEDHLNKILTLCVIGWGLAIMPIDQRGDLIEKTLKTLPEEARADGRALFEMMIDRKEMYFADNNRWIISHTLTMTPKGPHVDVVSTLVPM